MLWQTIWFRSNERMDSQSFEQPFRCLIDMIFVAYKVDCVSMTIVQFSGKDGEFKQHDR